MDNVERLRIRLSALAPGAGGEVTPAVRQALEGELLRDPFLIVQALPELRKLGAAAGGHADVERTAWAASIIERVLAGFGPVARQQFPTTELFARGLLELMDRALDPG
jgi:hypothetical protein